ncbi:MULTISPECIES: hypothetical protein [Streptomyces]|uniref:ABC-type Mn/Zn transport systems, ATPase component n=1 Tax=Streptomyces microflavus TaxID=1919 RepID=A0A7H8N0Y4_STRMI|nr:MULTISPECIES: hypothetical protein [Streptomyces]MBK5990395.1 hypothetical protein [Streptomyces sp. MBT58]QKW47973.1 hypothetical protein HUT09_36330 [Streptomyces microflavus]
MSERNTFIRSAHDLGLAAWFGGSLMGAVGLNSAADQEGVTEVGTARIASAGWAKWAPLGAVAIGAHLLGGAGIAAANRDRVRSQKGVTASTVAKTVLTGAALAATAYARVLGKKVDLATSEKEENQEAAEEFPMDTSRAQSQLALMQWAVPALTAGLVVLNALHGEQQRPSQQVRGALRGSLGGLNPQKR